MYMYSHLPNIVQLVTTPKSLGGGGGADTSMFHKEAMQNLTCLKYIHLFRGWQNYGMLFGNLLMRFCCIESWHLFNRAVCFLLTSMDLDN